MKQVNDATGIIEELISKGETVKTIAKYINISSRSVNYWRQGYRFEVRPIPTGQNFTYKKIKVKTGPSDKLMDILQNMLNHVRGDNK